MVEPRALAVDAVGVADVAESGRVGGEVRRPRQGLGEPLQAAARPLVDVVDVLLGEAGLTGDLLRDLAVQELHWPLLPFRRSPCVSRPVTPQTLDTVTDPRPWRPK